MRPNNRPDVETSSGARTDPGAHAGAVQVWWLSLEHGWDQACLWSLLSDCERERAASRSAPVARRFVIVRGALRLLLSRCTGQDPAAIAVEYGPRGKPFVAKSPHGPDIRFNLSHAGDLACYALASGIEVGVDIELIRPIPEAGLIAPLVVPVGGSPGPRPSASESSSERFLYLWVRMEAVLKAAGVGLADARTSATSSSFKEWSVHDLAAPSGYVAALATPPSRTRIRSAWMKPRHRPVQTRAESVPETTIYGCNT